MHHVRHKGRYRVRRRRIVRAEAIRLGLVTRIQRASNRSGRPGEVDSVSSRLRVDAKRK